MCDMGGEQPPFLIVRHSVSRREAQTVGFLLLQSVKYATRLWLPPFLLDFVRRHWK